MGVVNVTPDSFSDGGEWFDPDDAIAHGLALWRQGAQILDVGGESTRPGAERPSVSEELRRVVPVVAATNDAAPSMMQAPAMRARVATDAR
jgi:dihydropteroate synthase